jgi:hypothetical protein
MNSIDFDKLDRWLSSNYSPEDCMMISDLLLVEDQQTTNRSLRQCPNFGGGQLSSANGTKMHAFAPL